MSAGADRKKTDILYLAEIGASRPSLFSNRDDLKEDEAQTKILARALANYTSPKTTSFDLDFTIRLIETRPDWFRESVCKRFLEQKRERDLAGTAEQGKIVQASA